MSALRALRLFVALELPEPAVAALARVGECLDPSVWRAVPAESLHATLAFLGATDAALVPAAAGALAAACTGVEAPALALGEPLLLPPRRPRVMAVSLVDASGRLGALQADVARALAGARVYEPEAREFRPHVTVARLRPRVRPPRQVEPEPAVEPVRLAAVAVTLFSSHTTPSGARYEPLARVTLEGRGSAG